MIDINRKLKNFGPLEVLVLSSITYVVVMLLWTASTRSEVLQKANDIKSNHKSVVDFINDEVNNCSSNEEGSTSWGEKCNSVWSSDKIVNYVLNNIDLKNPYSINKPLIQTSQDPRIQAEGKAGQSTDKGIIFGAGLDVFENEPIDKTNPLLSNKKVLLSPHSATFTNECKSRMSLETTKNIIDFFENKIDKSMIVKL